MSLISSASRISTEKLEDSYSKTVPENGKANIFGSPMGLQCAKFAQLAFMPFGSEVINKNKDILSN